MKLERFLEQIRRLLNDGNRSQATDLLTEFLLDVYGRPAGLDMSNLHDLSQKQPGEIVAILNQVLRVPSGGREGPKRQPHFDPENLTDDDLALIKSTADDINLACDDYQPDEELGLEIPNERTAMSQALDLEPPQIESQPSETLPFTVSFKARPASTKKLSAAAPNISDPDIDLGNEPDSEGIFEPEKSQQYLCDFEEVAELNLDDDFIFGEDFEGFEDDDADKGADEYLLDDDDLIEDLERDFDVSVRDDLRHVDQDGSLTQDERAYQVALGVGLNYGWTKEGIDLLHEIFMERGCSQAQLAMRRALADGKTVDEVKLAKELKDLWEARADFSIAFYKARQDQSDCTYQGGRVLSWVMAFKVIKFFPEKTDISEIEFFLEQEYDLWFRPRGRKRSSLSFLDHLKNLTTPGRDFEGMLLDCVDFVGYERWAFEEYSEKDSIGTPLYSELVDLGLIPDIWLDYLDHSMGPVDVALLKDFIGT